MTPEAQVWLVRLADEVDQYIAARITASTGLRVQCVESLNEAIMRLSESAPCLVVADGSFGETERYKLYSRLQGRVTDREIPVLYASEEQGQLHLEPKDLPSVEFGNGVTVQEVADV